MCMPVCMCVCVCVPLKQPLAGGHSLPHLPHGPVSVAKTSVTQPQKGK